MLRIAHYYEKTYYSCFLPVAHGRHFLVDLTSQFWRYGVSKCRSSQFRSEAVQMDDA